MPANFIPAAKPEIKEKITFKSHGDYGDKETHTAGIIFKVLDKSAWAAAESVDKEVSEGYKKLVELAREKDTDKPTLDEASATYEDAIARRKKIAWNAVKGFTAETDTGEFEPVELTDDEIEALKNTKITDFEPQLITAFYRGQSGAIRKN